MSRKIILKQKSHSALVSKALTAIVLIANGAALHAQPATAVAVARGLENPWAVAFLPQGRFLVTERPGRMRVVQPDGQLAAPLAGVPPVAAAGQGGLLDVVTDADFANNQRIFFCYAEPAADGSNKNSTALASAVLDVAANTLRDVKVIFSQKPKVESRLHFGCRIVQAPGGDLWLALGDRYTFKNDAQTLGNHHGKVVRMAPDGSVPATNPVQGRPGALPEIWSWGHRNPQGASLGPDGQLWLHEHGPQGGDEINRPQAGRNYGWPVITYGENYGGGAIGKGTAQAGMEQPLHYWVPSIAPSGMAWVNSTRYSKAWQGSMLVGSLKFGTLHRLVWGGTRLLREEKVQRPGGGDLALGRIRDVRQGPDGWVYLLTDSPQGQLLRLQH